MPEKLSAKKTLSLIRLYLGGLSYGEIAAKAGVSKGTVANIIAGLKTGQLPAIRVGRRLLVPRRALEKLLDASCDPGTSY